MNQRTLRRDNYSTPLDGLGLCIFGCKSQKEADKMKAAAKAADKAQAEQLEAMRLNNELTAQQNAEVIAAKEAEARKTRIIILGVGGAIGVGLLITWLVRSNKKKS